ncbi:hypothetical protein H5410_045108 [Solanum commersonii]|uniref:Uncharacterized protein n=1 Tax=Solanum commersonii TaxID=4109 RepID=A0A9J5XA38_SOLCO|nr:hypothetical protein H5410_045108 [Solanum commersonii]
MFVRFNANYGEKVIPLNFDCGALQASSEGLEVEFLLDNNIGGMLMVTPNVCKEINNDVTHRIGEGRMKWRLAYGYLSDKRVPPKLKGKFCKVDMCGPTRRDKIKNEDIWNKVGVTSMADKMREARLKWFGHAKKRCADVLAKGVREYNLIWEGMEVAENISRQDAQCENFSVTIRRAPHVHNIFSGHGSFTLPNFVIYSSVQQLIIEKRHLDAGKETIYEEEGKREKEKTHRSYGGDGVAGAMVVAVVVFMCLKWRVVSFLTRIRQFEVNL